VPKIGTGIATCDHNGLAVFEHLRRKPTGRHVLLYAFDLLELDGTRPAARAPGGAQGDLGEPGLNEHLEHPEGVVVFQHACQLGCEGIVSKRLGSRYRSGRSPDWLKFKNPAAPAVRREAEEDWGK
jgi:bifunctional non-homologous end joining protein LigD